MPQQTLVKTLTRCFLPFIFLIKFKQVIKFRLQLDIIFWHRLSTMPQVNSLLLKTLGQPKKKIYKLRNARQCVLGGAKNKREDPKGRLTLFLPACVT